MTCALSRCLAVVRARHTDDMTGEIDLIYDRLVADEKLKDGTKYEKLGAIVFRILTETTTLHDLRLTGTVGVPHQIDIVVGADRRRILIEAKDYERKASLPVVRDFSAVVEDLKPDEAFVVSTVGFSSNAQRGQRLRASSSPSCVCPKATRTGATCFSASTSRWSSAHLAIRRSSGLLKEPRPVGSDRARTPSAGGGSTT